MRASSVGQIRATFYFAAYIRNRANHFCTVSSIFLSHELLIYKLKVSIWFVTTVKRPHVLANIFFIKPTRVPLFYYKVLCPKLRDGKKCTFVVGRFVHIHICPRPLAPRNRVIPSRTNGCMDGFTRHIISMFVKHCQRSRLLAPRNRAILSW